MISIIAAALVLALSPAAQSLSGIASSAFAQGSAPGMAVAVVQNGHVVYSAGFGYADRAGKRAATAQTRFAIGSLTKQFTAVGILSLVQSGKMSLDDRLAKYFPNLPNARGITVRELLNQTSGLHNYPYPNEHAWPWRGPVNVARILGILATDKPDFAPGTRFEYSNSNYTVLSAIIEKVSGLSYGRYLQTHIFAPLQMSRSGYGYALQHTGDLAVPYASGEAVPASHRITLDLYAGAGGIVSTADDLARWDIALLQGSLLNAQSMRELWTPGQPRDGQSAYAMGFVADMLDGQRYVWHNGYSPQAGGYCYNAIFPEQHLAIVVLTNADLQDEQGKPEALVRRVFEAYVPVTARADDPAVTALAKKMLHAAQSGDLDRTDMTPAFSAYVTPAVAAQAQQAWGALGSPQSLTLIRENTSPQGTEYFYRAQFAGGIVKTLWITLTNGKVSGFTMR